MILDAAMVVIGVILGGKFGVCTVVTVIVSGPIIQFYCWESKENHKAINSPFYISFGVIP